MNSKQKAAVLGTGSIGCRHLEVLKGLEVQTVAVPVREARRLELQAQGWICADSLRAAKEDGATIAIIATDTNRHVPDTEEALSLGLHVLLEKPMGPSANQTKHLSRLAAGLGLGLFVGCPLRFDPGLETVRRRLEEIGRIHVARIECRSFLPDWRPGRDYRRTYSARADEGGVLRDLIHEVDYALWLFGMPQELFGRLGNLSRLGIESEEMAESLWVEPGGACISIGLDYLSRHGQRSLRICGEQGEIEYDFITRKLNLHRVAASPEEFTFPKSPNDIYIRQMTEFLRIAGGEPPNLIATAEDGTRALAVCDAWRQSAVTNRLEPVSL